MSDPNDIQIAGEFRANRAIVKTYTGEEIDIVLHIDRISIFEDLFSPFLTVELEIRDAIGLKNKVPFRGEELITLSVTDVDGKYGLIDSVFSIYKLKDLVQVSDRSFQYRLCCVSIEAIVDMNLKISKAYSGQASDIVHKLVVEEGLETDKEVFIEETKNKLSYISNYWSPIKNLKYISDRAVTRDGTSASCLFYETKRGFAFASLHNLTSAESVATYQFTVGNMNNVEKGLSRIEKVWIDTGFDYIERLASGAFGNRSLLVDPYNKTYSYGYYDFVDAFADRNHLNPQSFATDSSTRRLNSMFRSRIVPSRSFADMKTEASEQWFRQRVTELAAINTFNIQIEVAGRLDMLVGQVVDVFLYAGQVPNDGSSRNDLNEMIDKVYSGRYLITGIRHTLNKERHVMNLHLSKDSLIDIE
jgi:hypothetical protein